MQKGRQLGSISMGAIAAAALLASANLAQADTFTYQMGDGQAGTAGAKDTWIVKGPAANVNADPDNTNNGADPKLRMRSYSGSGNGERVSLVAFPNLIGTGAGQFDPALASQVQSATLRLTLATGSNASKFIAAHQLLDDWVEGNGSYSIVPTAGKNFFGATWNNAAAYSDGTTNVPWTTGWVVDRSGAAPAITGPIGPMLSKGVVTAGTPTVEDWDVTGALMNWLSGQPNYGVALWQSDYDNSEFVAKETTAQVGYAAQLIIVTPEPASLGLLAVGSLLAIRRRREV